jgi:hypothetical protein
MRQLTAHYLTVFAHWLLRLASRLNGPGGGPGHRLAQNPKSPKHVDLPRSQYRHIGGRPAPNTLVTLVIVVQIWFNALLWAFLGLDRGYNYA